MRAGVLAIIAGALLLIAGAGSSTLLFDQVGAFVTEQWPDAGDVVETILKALSFLAAFGGLVIIIGGVLMLMGLERLGRILTVIAAIMALVGLILVVVVLIDQGEGDGGWLADVGLWISAIGVLLAFWARP